MTDRINFFNSGHFVQDHLTKNEKISNFLNNSLALESTAIKKRSVLGVSFLISAAVFLLQGILLFILMNGSVLLAAQKKSEASNNDQRVQSGADIRMDKNVYFAYRSFWPEHETMKKFSRCGIHTYCLFPSSTCNSLGEPYGKYPAIWRYPESYDWNSLHRQFDEIIAFDSQAEFLCMVDLNSPIWLTRMLAMNGDGNFDSFIDLVNCLSNAQWKAMTMKYLEDFIVHVEKRYGKRIRAYILACGQTDEWMNYSANRTSRAWNNAFQQWSKKQNISVSNMPISFGRYDGASFENFVRDPSKEGDILNAVRFEQDLVVDSIIDFARRTKELTGGKKETGVFFGYIMELTGFRMIGSAHLGYERLYASPELDFFISPGTYSARNIGEGSGFMIPNETRLLNNKGFMHEIDHRTTTYNCDLNEYVSIKWMKSWKTEWDDIVGLRRELCLGLINHSSVWFFDMWGGSFDKKSAIDNLGKMKKIWDKYSADRSRSAAEILLVVDPQSTSLLSDRNNYCNLIHNFLRNQLNQTGAPFAVCSFNDLKKLDLSPYKMVVMTDEYLITPDRKKLLDEKVLNSKRTVLWIHAPGICNGTNLDIKRVRDLTGFDYGKAGINSAPRDGWTSVYIHKHQTVTSSVLRQIAIAAGVNIYLDDYMPVYANGKLVMIHVLKGGKKKITLPGKYRKITEVFTGKIAAENAASFEYEFKSPDTALFEIEKQ